MRTGERPPCSSTSFSERRARRSSPGHKGGPGVWTGTTAGFLAAFVVAAFVTGWLAERLAARGRPTFSGFLGATIVGSFAVIGVLGWSFVAFRAHLDFDATLAALTPFLPGDAIKAFLAAGVAVAVHAAYPQILAGEPARGTGTRRRARRGPGPLGPPVIELQDASVVAPGTGVRILEPTTLTLTERRVAVIGANGSGKSTLARLVNGLALPATGSVRVFGRDTRRQAAAVRRDVGFLFTDPSAQLIMPTAAEDIALSLRRTVRGKDERARAALAALEAIGLGDKGGVSVHALSGGQRQLLALAGVLAVEPRIVVADEPTTLLDLRWRAHVDALLASLDQMLLEVTHDLDAAARADRVLVVDSGRVIFDGAPAAAIAAYRDLMGGPS